MPEQNRSFFYPGIDNRALMASAGTGKTFNVAMRFISLVYYGAKASSICAATFTNKAAGEIFDKIITVLIQCASEPKTLEDLRLSHKLPETIRKEDVLRILRELLTGSDSLQIGTLDSFFLKILQAFPAECGIWDRIRITDDRDDRLRVPALAGLFRDLPDELFVPVLEAVKAACDRGDDREFFEKMLSFTKELCSLYRSCPCPEKWGTAVQIWPEYREDWILATPVLASTVQAAAEAVEALGLQSAGDSILRYVLYVPEYRTVPSQEGDTPLKVPLKLREANPGFPFEDDGPLDYFYSKKEYHIPETAAGLLRILTRHLIGSAFRDKTNQAHAAAVLLMMYDNQCGRAIRQRGHLSFEEVPALLKEHPAERQEMESRLDARFLHYILDEFQDTSTLQWQMLEPLVSEALTGDDGEKRSFFYVGDVKQSIYQWRKGNPELFERIADKYGFCGERRINLDKNGLNLSFRSSRPVLEFVNRVFPETAPATGDKIIDDAFRRLHFQPHESAPSAARQNGAAAILQVPCSSNSDRMTRRAEVIFDSLMEIRPFDGKDLSVGILVLKNDTANLIADELKRLAAEKNVSLPVTVQGKMNCTGTMPSFIAVRLLRLAFHPDDPVANRFLSVLTMEEEGGGPVSVTPSLMGEWLGSEKTVSGWRELSGMLRLIFEREGCAGILRRFRQGVEKRIPSPELERLRSLEKEAAAFDRREQGMPDEFIDSLEWSKASRTSLSKTVQIMTVHASKGLDFDVVYLPELRSKNGISSASPGRYPVCGTTPDFEPEWITYLPRKEISSMIPPLAELSGKNTGDSCYEDLCCLYVAMTRARHAMYVLADPKKDDSKKKKETWILERIVCHRIGEPEDPSVSETMEANLNRHREGREPVQIPWAYGDPCWYLDPGKKMKTIDPEAEESFHAREEALKNFHPREVTLVPSLRMTKKTASGEEPSAGRRGMLFASRRSALLGSRIHAVLAGIDWMDPACQPETVLGKLLSREERGTGLEELLAKALSSPDFASLFHRPETGIAELWREKAFLVRNREKTGEYVPGICDRVMIYRENAGDKPVSALIADFKTDALPDGEAFRKLYSGQLQLYRESVAALTGLMPDRIECRIASVRLGECFHV